MALLSTFGTDRFGNSSLHLIYIGVDQVAVSMISSGVQEHQPGVIRDVRRRWGDNLLLPYCSISGHYVGDSKNPHTYFKYELLDNDTTTVAIGNGNQPTFIGKTLFVQRDPLDGMVFYTAQKGKEEEKEEEDLIDSH